MCLGIPMQVIEGGMQADCRDAHGAVHRVDMLLVGPQPAGAWLLTYLGAAREVIDARRAADIGRALSALEQLSAGMQPDLDAAFADLLEREPQLPEFLRKG
ncbi:MAG: HypC/HybG/HupF family hydrogenase formation chaperone [Rhodocyclaceae bacterium]|nr:HypC/HybG/HupF family hydrogenase formation chaperone [Rhodocyclaceae bacterium]